MPNNLSKVVGSIAPILGNVLNLALPGSGLVISSLAHLFGANPDDESDIASKISADPDAYLKLKQFEMTHAEELAKLEAADRENARGRENTIVSSTGKRDWVMDYLAVFIVVAFFGMCLLVAFIKIDPNISQVFYMLLGALAGGFSVILNYYWGSSAGVKNINSQKPEVVLPPPAQTR